MIALQAVLPAKAEVLYNSEAGQSIFALVPEHMDSRFGEMMVKQERITQADRDAEGATAAQ